MFIKMSAAELSEKELRKELTSYGLKPGPITSTTKFVYIKRLEELRKGKESLPAKKNRRQSRALPPRKYFGFSSDESDNNEENKDVTSKSKMKPPKPSTPSPVTLLKVLELGKKSSDSAKKPLHSRVADLSGKVTPRRPIRISTTPVKTNGYSDDSDDDNSEDNDSGDWIAYADVSTSPNNMRRSGSLPGSHSSTPKKEYPSTPKRHSRRSHSGFSPESVNHQSSTRRSVESRQSLPIANHSDETDDAKSLWRNGVGTDSDSTDLRRRIPLDATAETPDANGTNRTDSNSNHDTPESQSQTGFMNSLLKLPQYFNRQWDRSSQPDESQTNTPFPEVNHLAATASSSWSLQCSVLLPILTVTFFIVLGLLYISMKTDSALGQTLSLVDGEKPSNELEKTMENVNIIFEVLAKATGNRICRYYNSKEHVSIAQIKLVAQIDSKSFMSALHVICRHPEWEISFYGVTNATMNKLPSNHSCSRLSEVEFMSSGKPILPALCRFQRAVEKVLFRVSVVLAGALLVWLLIVYRQYAERKRDEEKQTVFDLVEKILDLLKNQHESSATDDAVQPYVPIVQARDIIIPFQHRRKMRAAWEKAVHFLSASESRIRVETQRVAGQDLKVWRWIQVLSPGKRGQLGGQQGISRTWQGEAFDTSRSHPNISPTPCLKIRNMFDPDVEKGTDWEYEIHDAILEKCSRNHQIFNIVVEKASNEGLVYVKCGSCAAAGEVFRSLHGSWFGGRLVTVKFIKLARFHARYPHLPATAAAPLTPHHSRPVSRFLHSGDV